MPKRGSQFFTPGAPQVVSWPVVGLALPEGVGASAYASTPSPTGFRWDFVTLGGERVTLAGVPVVALVGI